MGTGARLYWSSNVRTLAGSPTRAKVGTGWKLFDSLSSPCPAGKVWIARAKIDAAVMRVY